MWKMSLTIDKNRMKTTKFELESNYEPLVCYEIKQIDCE